MKETLRRKRFFDTALRLINEKGFKAMTMRLLADELQCDVSNIYNYVKSKHALLEQLLFEISNKFHEGMTAIESSSYGPLEKIKSVIAMHVRITTEHPYQVALLTSEWRNLNTEKEKEFLAFRQTYEKKLQSIINAGITSGDFSDTNEEFLVNSILSAIRWLYSWYSPDENELNPIEIERLMTNFILKGIMK